MQGELPRISANDGGSLSGSNSELVSAVVCGNVGGFVRVNVSDVVGIDFSFRTWCASIVGSRTSPVGALTCALTPIVRLLVRTTQPGCLDGSLGRVEGAITVFPPGLGGRPPTGAGAAGALRGLNERRTRRDSLRSCAEPTTGFVCGRT